MIDGVNNRESLGGHSARDLMHDEIVGSGEQANFELFLFLLVDLSNEDSLDLIHFVLYVFERVAHPVYGNEKIPLALPTEPHQ